eukprot:6711041-Lingulodinium_polyedra.AAC.1
MFFTTAASSEFVDLSASTSTECPWAYNWKVVTYHCQALTEARPVEEVLQILHADIVGLQGTRVQPRATLDGTDLRVWKQRRGAFDVVHWPAGRHGGQESCTGVAVALRRARLRARDIVA